MLMLAVVAGVFAAGLIARGEAAGSDARAYWAGTRIWLNGGDPYPPHWPIPALRLRAVAPAGLRTVGAPAVGRGLVRLARRSRPRAPVDDPLGLPPAAARDGDGLRPALLPDRGEHRHRQHHPGAGVHALGGAVQRPPPGRPALGAGDLGQVGPRAVHRAASPAGSRVGPRVARRGGAPQHRDVCRSRSSSSRRSSGSVGDRYGWTISSCSGQRSRGCGAIPARCGGSIRRPGRPSPPKPGCGLERGGSAGGPTPRWPLPTRAGRFASGSVPSWGFGPRPRPATSRTERLADERFRLESGLEQREALRWAWLVRLRPSLLDDRPQQQGA